LFCIWPALQLFDHSDIFEKFSGWAVTAPKTEMIEKENKSK
jgi:hypothetical protein